MICAVGNVYLGLEFPSNGGTTVDVGVRLNTVTDEGGRASIVGQTSDLDRPVAFDRCLGAAVSLAVVNRNCRPSLVQVLPEIDAAMRDVGPLTAASNAAPWSLVTVAVADESGWTGGLIQVALGDYGSARFHIRLFKVGNWTVANTHFEVLIPGTADHQVLSRELAEQLVIARLRTASPTAVLCGRTRPTTNIDESTDKQAPGLD